MAGLGEKGLMRRMLARIPLRGLFPYCQFDRLKLVTTLYHCTIINFNVTHQTKYCPFCINLGNENIQIFPIPIIQ